MVQEEKESILIHPLPYWGDVAFWRAVVKVNTLVVPPEPAVRQTFRNRCTIDGPNGAQMLSIPLKQFSPGATTLSQQTTDPAGWGKQHLKSIATTYGSSPWFDSLEAEIKALYASPIPSLAAFNLRIFLWVTGVLDLNIRVVLADEQEAWEALDTGSIKPYPQVFDDRHGFRPNLSILDVLCNLGRETSSYLLIP